MKEKRFVSSARGGAARFGFCCALLVFALALTGCNVVRDYLGLDSEEEPDPPAPAPEAELIVSAAAFSNAAVGAEDSAIDRIKGNTGVSSVLVQLPWGNEPVSFDAAHDIGPNGLVLTYTEGPDANTSPAVVIIDGGGRVVDLTGSAPGSLITVGDGVTLTLRNIVFKGLDKTKGPGDDTNNNAALIKVDGGYLILEDGAEIRDNYNSDDRGGGVWVVDKDGTFIMNGGVIGGNKAVSGGGVWAGGTFIMNGGIISGNEAGSGGGVESKSEFLMNGGTISDNTATSNSAGGVYVPSGTFTMKGGTISGNKVTFTGGSTYGGGVSAHGGKFIMEGGAISGHKTDGGGGVYANKSGAFTKTGGTIYGSDAISTLQNTANKGGAAVRVFVSMEPGFVQLYRERNSTAGPDVNMDSEKDGAEGGWEEN